MDTLRKSCFVFYRIPHSNPLLEDAKFEEHKFLRQIIRLATIYHPNPHPDSKDDPTNFRHENFLEGSEENKKFNGFCGIF